LDHTRISSDRVAFLDEQDVAHHDLGGEKTLRLAIADHQGVCGGHLAQRGHGRFSPRFLDEAYPRIQENDDPDRDGFVG
jgi:hypothetical protein